ncbi:hypothetical protein OH809_39765 [Streptomyces sp. NBC_00873]|uniref:hypothetical protein n=1 Tax=unclassified Streptomyces TaxID=2593676 RepID=UPI00386B7AF4|nr:hypothetical protein OH809_39765 [Streptomyces sp. NBC_00873]WTA41899.1 hypothetical protein OH821_03930 [Streptomyces sp. NBC_00842]
MRDSAVPPVLRGRLTRRQAVPDEDRSDVWAVMSTLAKCHGPENARIVVWLHSFFAAWKPP